MTRAPRVDLALTLRRAGHRLLALPAPLVLGTAALWMFGIWLLSSRDLGPKGTTAGLGAVLGNLAHAPLFGLLGLLFASAFLRGAGGAWPRIGRAATLRVLLPVLVYGIVDELHQSYTPGRDASALDVLTDVVGAGCVLWIIAYLGDAAATEAGLRQRLLLGVVACILCAVLGVAGDVV
jgi:hypothetical protein